MRDSVTLACLLIFATDVFIAIAKASAEDGCYWAGSGPSCQDSSCQSDEFVSAESRTGPDGIQCVTGLKKYCCKRSMESQWIGKDDPDILVTPSPLQSVSSNCYWTGSPPDCQGFCQEGEYVAATSRGGNGKDCITGSKKLCCKTPAILPSPGFAVQMKSIETTTPSPPSLEERGKSCYWVGTAPICDGWCQAGEYVAAQSRKGNDGNMCASGYKKYCCKMWNHRVYPPTIQIFVVNSTVRRYVPTEDGQSIEYNQQTISLSKLTSTIPPWTRITPQPQRVLTSPSPYTGNNSLPTIALKQTSPIENNSTLNQTNYSTPASSTLGTSLTSISFTKEMNISTVNENAPSSNSNTTKLMELNSNSSTTVYKSPPKILSTTMTSTSFEQFTGDKAPKIDTYSTNSTELHKQIAEVDTSIISTTMNPTTFLSTSTTRPITTSLSSTSFQVKTSMSPLFVPEDPSTKFTSSSMSVNTTEEQTMSDESPIDEENSTSLLPLSKENEDNNDSSVVKTTTSPSVRTSSLQKLFSSLKMTTETLSLSSKLANNQPTTKIPYLNNSNIPEVANFSVLGSQTFDLTLNRNATILPNVSKFGENKTHPQLSPSSFLAPPSIFAPLLNFSNETENVSDAENASSATESGDAVVVNTTHGESKLSTDSLDSATDLLSFSNHTNPTTIVGNSSEGVISTQPIDKSTAAFPILTTSAPLPQVKNSTKSMNEPLRLSDMVTLTSIISNKSMIVSSPTSVPPFLQTHHSLPSGTLDDVQTMAEEDAISTSSPHSGFVNLSAAIPIVIMQNVTQKPTTTKNMQTTATLEFVSEDLSSEPQQLVTKQTSSVPSSSVQSNSTMLVPLILQNTTRSMERSNPSSSVSSTTSTTFNSQPLFVSSDSKLNRASSTPSTLIGDASLIIESKQSISAESATSKSTISTLTRNKATQFPKSQLKTVQPMIITPVPEPEATTTSFETVSTSFTSDHTLESSSPIPSLVPVLSTTTKHESITEVLSNTIPDMNSTASFPMIDGDIDTTSTTVESAKAAKSQSHSTNRATSTSSESTPLNSKETTTIVTILATTTPPIKSNEATDLSDLDHPDQHDRMDVEVRKETTQHTLMASPVLFPIDQPLSMTLNQKWVPMVAEQSQSHLIGDTIARIPMSADMVAIPPLNGVQLFQTNVGPKPNQQSSKLNTGKELGNNLLSGFIPMMPPIPQN